MRFSIFDWKLPFWTNLGNTRIVSLSRNLVPTISDRILLKFQKSLSPPKQCCEPITKLDARFAHCFSTLLRGGSGEKHEIIQIAVFPIIFVTGGLKKSEKF